MRNLRIAAVTALVFGLVQAQAAEGPGGRRGGRSPFRPPASPVMQALDADGNGEISAEEMQKAAAALKALDKNGDGKLAQEEIRSQFGRFRGRGDPRFGRGRGPGGGGVSQSAFDARTVPKDDGEKRILAAIEEARRGPRFANVPERDGRLLRQLTEAIGAKRVVEIGTSTGESGMWFALALRTTGGKLITHEIDSGRARVAKENFKKAGVEDLVTVIVGDAHETVKQHKEPIDILFLDADKEGYIDYLNKLVPLLRAGGLIIAHNMNTRQADARYVKEITTNPNFETLFLHMDRTGVGVTMKKRSP